MEGEGFGRFKRQPRLDHQFVGLEESDGDEDDVKSADFFCPFCGDEFDLVGLCLHVDDEHPEEAASRVCPICAERVGSDLISHMIIQHASFYKIQRRRRSRRGSFSRKDINEDSQHFYFGGSKRAVASDPAPDPLLHSFVSTLSISDAPKDNPSGFQNNKDRGCQKLDEKLVESAAPSVPEEDKEERARRSQFAQGLVFSTIFDELW